MGVDDVCLNSGFKGWLGEGEKSVEDVEKRVLNHGHQLEASGQKKRGGRAGKAGPEPGIDEVIP